ncbi:MAG TPA: BON domain-containing protein [Anaerolineales bacterium]|nr:BON domain-containing protein [Anaerolineales bacterium]
MDLLRIPLRRRAEKAAHQIPGVLRVENHLVVDEDLKLAAAGTVAQIPESPVERIFVGAQSGFITLTGEVASIESRLAAEERAGSVPEIRGVLNRIRVAGLEFPEPRALQLAPARESSPETCYQAMSNRSSSNRSIVS